MLCGGASDVKEATADVQQIADQVWFAKVLGESRLLFGMVKYL